MCFVLFVSSQLSDYARSPKYVCQVNLLGFVILCHAIRAVGGIAPHRPGPRVSTIAVLVHSAAGDPVQAERRCLSILASCSAISWRGNSWPTPSQVIISAWGMALLSASAWSMGNIGSSAP